jgi:hypothetical protein
VDAGGRQVRDLQAGSTLHVGAAALAANSFYEFRATLDDGQTVAFARVTTNRLGSVEPFGLWYEAGVVGCATRANDRADRARNRFARFEEAESALAGRRLEVTARRIVADPGGTARNELGPVEHKFQLPLLRRRSPMVFPSDSTACLTNATETGTTDLHVSGRNFSPGEELEISVVENQRAWHVGDVVRDVTGRSANAAPKRVRVDANGRFTVRAWDRTSQFSGSFDVVARRISPGRQLSDDRLGAEDIVSFGAETAFVLFLQYPVGGPQMDVAGRRVPAAPFFVFSDAFADSADPVWAAVDPTYVPEGHLGGTVAAYYVVAHKSEAEWLADSSLVDVSGAVEVHPVKAGCINQSDAVIWNESLVPGEYDVVVEFGSVSADDVEDFISDGRFDPSVDFVDGAVQVGFTVASDPYELGPFPIGAVSYSEDDFFETIGDVFDVDLRAVVRYPATATGNGTPVAAGSHPIFLIQHGNHPFCEDADETHASCPVDQRIRSHEGYMRLLEILASHGAIAVSMDAYDMSGPLAGQWIEERGDLILRHLELWSHMNDATTFPSYPDFFSGQFAGHLDFTRVSVSGHSRGGEASVSAFLQNAMRPEPFGIGSVSSIAPIDGNAFVLPAVPYFVLVPASDCDIDLLHGRRIYDRAGSEIGDSTVKSLSYIYGANHNFFNTVWAASDDCPDALRPDYIWAEDQQRIGEAYLAGFHRSHLLGAAVYDEMLRSALVFPSTSGFKIYRKHHEAQHRRLIDGSDDPPDVVALGGATVESVGNSPESGAMEIDWTSNDATVTFHVPASQRDASGFEVLSFRVGLTFDEANAPDMAGTFIVELIGGGVRRLFTTRVFDVFPYPYAHPTGWQHVVKTTVRIPLHSFVMNNSEFALNDIQTIRLRFTERVTGQIRLDDFEFSR